MSIFIDTVKETVSLSNLLFATVLQVFSEPTTTYPGPMLEMKYVRFEKCGSPQATAFGGALFMVLRSNYLDVRIYKVTFIGCAALFGAAMHTVSNQKALSMTWQGARVIHPSQVQPEKRPSSLRLSYITAIGNVAKSKGIFHFNAARISLQYG